MKEELEEKEEIEKEEKEEEKIKRLEERLRAGDKEMIIVNLVERTSEGYYNYKSNIYAVYLEPEFILYEDEYVMTIRVEEIYCGVYQSYRCYDVYKILDNLQKEGFKIKKIF